MADGKVVIETKLDSSGAEQGMRSLDGKLSGAASTLTSTGGKLIAASTAVLGVGGAAVKTAASFEKAMDQVQATMLKSDDEFNAITVSTKDFSGSLSELAIHMGSTTMFSASEAAEALNYMALAGYDAQTMAETLPSVLNLAAAGNMDLASASDMVTDALSALGKGSDYAEVLVDQMAKTASTSNTSVSQLGEAILTIGGIGKEVAGDTSELNAALGILANSGIKGSEAGTKLRNIILKLSSPTKDGATALEALGVSAFDADGDLRPLNETFRDLSYAMANLTQEDKLQAVSDIFNTRDVAAVSALMAGSATNVNELANALSVAGINVQDFGMDMDTLKEFMVEMQEGVWGEGEEAITEFAQTTGKELGFTEEQSRLFFETLSAGKASFTDLKAGIDDAAGSAQAMVDIQLGNLVRQIDLLKSALEAMAISIGNELMPYIKSATAYVQSLIDKFNGLDESQKQKIVKIGLAFAGIVGGLGTALLAVGNFIKIISSLKGVLTAFKVIAEGVGAAIGSISLPVVAVVAAIAVLAAAFKHLWDTNEEFRNNITAIWENIKETVISLVETIGTNLAALWEAFQGFIQRLQPAWDAFCNFLAPVFEVALQLLGGRLEQLLQEFNAVIVFLTDVFNGNWEKIWEDLINIFHAVMDPWINLFQTIWEGIVDFFKNVWNGIKQFFANLWNGIKSNIINVWNSIKQFFTTTIPQIVTDIITFFSQLPEKIAYELGYALASIVLWIAECVNTVRTKVPQIIEAVVNFFKELPGKVWTWLLNTIAKVIAWTTQMKTKAREAGTQFINTLIDYIKNLPQKIQDVFNNVMKKVKDFIEDFKRKAKEAGEGFKDKILEALKKIPDKVKEIGGEIVKGIWEGISGGWKWLTEQLSNLAESLLKGVKDKIAQAKTDEQAKIDNMPTGKSGQTTQGGVITATNASSMANVSTYASGFNYKSFGEATADALMQAGLSVKVGTREFGRIVREVL